MFPNEIKVAMRDCILKIIWPRDDLVVFFKDNNCCQSDIKSLGDYKQHSRSKIVDIMFAHLATRHDEGLGQFRSMLNSLINWATFDPYYFDKLRKLNRDEANRSIIHLQQVQLIWDDKIRKQRAEREARRTEAQKPTVSLSEIHNQFLKLFKGEIVGQERGYAFEGILHELARISSLEVTEPFKVNGEQIDGAIKHDGEHYIIEAKWQDRAASNEPVYQFAGKVEGKMYGRGIFFSIQGYSDNVIQSLIAGKAIKTIFVDGADIFYVLEEILDFRTMLDNKIKAAQTKGLIYIDPISEKSKL